MSGWRDCFVIAFHWLRISGTHSGAETPESGTPKDSFPTTCCVLENSSSTGTSSDRFYSRTNSLTSRHATSEKQTPLIFTVWESSSICGTHGRDPTRWWGILVSGEYCNVIPTTEYVGLHDVTLIISVPPCCAHVTIELTVALFAAR